MDRDDYSSDGSDLPGVASIGLDTDSSSSVSGGLDMTGARIGFESMTSQGLEPKPKDAPCIVLPNQSEEVSLVALDIGGSLIKLVYFTKDSSGAGGKLHFCKFPSTQVEECIDFIEAKALHAPAARGARLRVKATGGGAFKYAERFKERLGLLVEREDEMACMVDGCNFLLRTVRDEAFSFEQQQMAFEDVASDEVYPYLLVNIGSGVSMVKVEGEKQFVRVSGTNIGGGTFLGLSRLLTGLNDFDEILDLSSRGDNSNVDMLVGDIYGGRDYTGIGLSATTIASSFGKVLHAPAEARFRSEDMVVSLCRMISYNIGQLAYLNAKRYNLRRIFFGGFFIRGHPHTMDTISFAIRFWSQGEMAAHFLRHEGFIGALGAFLRAPAAPLALAASTRAGPAAAREARARFVERFYVGAPLTGGAVRGPAMVSVHDKVTWVEKFIAAARPLAESARSEHQAALRRAEEDAQEGARRRREAEEGSGGAVEPPASTALVPLSSGLESGVLPPFVGSTGFSEPPSPSNRITMHVGVLQFSPSFEPFPLLPDIQSYSPSTVDIGADPAELQYWVDLLRLQIPTVVEKAAASEQAREAGWVSPDTKPALTAMDLQASALALQQHPGRKDAAAASGTRGAGPGRAEPSASLACSSPTHIEPSASLVSSSPTRIQPCTSLVSASPTQIQPCTSPVSSSPTKIEPCTSGTSPSPPAPSPAPRQDPHPPSQQHSAAQRRAASFGRTLDHHLRSLRANPRAYGSLGLADLFELREECLREFGFRDVYASDKAREHAAALEALPDLLTQLDARPVHERLLALVQGALAANIFDWGAQACVDLYQNATILEMYRTACTQLSCRPWLVDDLAELARVWYSRAEIGADGRVERALSPFRRALLFVDNAGADVVLGMLPLARELLRMGAEVVMVANELPAINDVTARELRRVVAAAAEICPILAAARAAAVAAKAANDGRVPPAPGVEPRARSGSPLKGASFGSDGREATRSAAQVPSTSAAPPLPPSPAPTVRKGMFGESYPSPWPDPRLFIVSSGSGSPCLDLRRISCDLADAATGADLVVIEGMGRALHTNYHTRLSCHTLKLAMLKNAHLAKMFGGKVYDCICRFDPAMD